MMRRMTVLTLESEHWHLEVLPEVGGSVLNLLGRTGGAWRPVLRVGHPLLVQSSSQTGGFVLAPFSNRIRGAHFTFEGREVQLRPTTGTGTQHGDVRNRPWRVAGQTRGVLTLAFDGREVPDLNWPWPFTVQSTFQLDGQRLHQHLRLVNASDTAMPAGFGLHPYFARRDDKGRDPTVTLPAARVYDVDEGQVPETAARPVTPDLDFRAARAVGTATIDRTYTEWDGSARLDWRARALTLRADPVFSHVILFTAPDGSLALEPVTNATDGFNLMARGVPGTGVRVLAPGEALEGTVTLALEGEW